jgi:hypothetical protein
LKEKTPARPLWRLALEETMVVSEDSLRDDGTETHKHTHRRHSDVLRFSFFFVLFIKEDGLKGKGGCEDLSKIP